MSTSNIGTGNDSSGCVWGLVLIVGLTFFPTCLFFVGLILLSIFIIAFPIAFVVALVREISRHSRVQKCREKADMRAVCHPAAHVPASGKRSSF